MKTVDGNDDDDDDDDSSIPSLLSDTSSLADDNEIIDEITEVDMLMREKELFKYVYDHIERQIKTESIKWDIASDHKPYSALSQYDKDLAIWLWRNARLNYSAIDREQFYRAGVEPYINTDDTVCFQERGLKRKKRQLEEEYMCQLRNKVNRLIRKKSRRVDEVLSHMSALDSNSSLDEILIDSGANVSILNSAQRSRIMNLTEYHADLTGSNGTASGAITGRGFTTILDTTISVCYAPNITRSVISVPQLQASGKFKIVFAGDQCTIINIRTKEELVVERTSDNLYKLPSEAISVLAVSNVATVKDPDELKLWHHKLGHIGTDRLKAILSAKAYNSRGLKLSSTSKLKEPLDVCQACALTRPLRYQSTQTPESKSLTPATRWHYDVSGPNETPSLSGQKYLHVFIDEATGETYVDHTKGKETKEILSVHQRFYDETLSLYIGRGVNNSQLVGDNAELSYAAVRAFWHSKGVSLIFTAPYHSAANGVAERAIRTIKEISRALLAHAGRPEFLWDYATKHAALLMMITPRLINGKLQVDAFQRRYQRMYNYNRLHVWGCDCFVTQQLETKGYTPRNLKGIYVGNDGYAYIVFIPGQMKEIKSGDAIFDDRLDDRSSKIAYSNPSLQQTHDVTEDLLKHTEDIKKHVYVDKHGTVYMRRRPEGLYTEGEFKYLIGLQHYEPEISEYVKITKVRTLKGNIVCDRHLASNNRYIDSFFALDAALLCAVPILQAARTKTTGESSSSKGSDRITQYKKLV